MKYRQLTQTQRYQISALRVVGKSQRQIAAMLGCHNSTISRELRRNSVHGYVSTTPGVAPPSSATNECSG